MAKSALIIIDMVYDFVDPNGLVYYPDNQIILPKIKEALKLARENKLLIIFIEHTYRKDKYDANLTKMRKCCIKGSGGEKTVSALTIEKEDYVIAKRRYSAFFGTDLNLVLSENKIKNIILVGTKTNNCIYASALDGYYLNYNVLVIKECVATNDQFVNQVYLNDINKYVGTIATFDEYQQLLGSRKL